MKKIWTFLRDLFYGVHELLFLFPFLMIFLYFVLSEEQWMKAILYIGVSLLLGVYGRRVFAEKKIWTRIAVGLPIVLAGGFILFPAALGAPSYLTSVLATAVLIWGLRVPLFPFNDSMFFIRRIIIAVTIYMVLYVLILSIKALAPCRTLIEISGTIYLLCSAIILNRSHLMFDAILLRRGEKDQVPRSVMRHNWLFLGVFLIITAVAVNASQIKGLLIFIVRFVILVIITTIEFLGSIFSSTPIDEPKSNRISQLNPSKLVAVRHEWWEQAFLIIALIIAIAASLVLLYIAGKKLHKLLKILIKYIREKLFKNTGQDFDEYVDESENFFSWGKLQKNFSDGVKKWWQTLSTREEKWTDFSNNQDRIRFLYRSFLRKLTRMGEKDLLYKTPIEVQKSSKLMKTAGDETETLIRAYMTARYSQETISDDLATKALKAFEKIKQK